MSAILEQTLFPFVVFKEIPPSRCQMRIALKALSGISESVVVTSDEETC